MVDAVNEATRVLARAASLASRLGGTLDALKVSVAKRDIPMARLQAPIAELLLRRLDETLDRPAFADALELAADASDKGGPADDEGSEQ